jgi:magnesium-transporting ATPase (P-type)
LSRWAREQAAERELQSRRIYASRSTLAESTARARQEHDKSTEWTSSTDTVLMAGIGICTAPPTRKRAKAERKAGVHWGLDARKIVTPSQRSIPIIVPMVVVMMMMMMVMVVVIPATGRNHINARTVTVTVTVTVTPPMMVMVMVMMMVPLR